MNSPRFLVFAGDAYGAGWGMNDLQYVCTSEEHALEKLVSCCKDNDWAQIGVVDEQGARIIKCVTFPRKKIVNYAKADYETWEWSVEPQP